MVLVYIKYLAVLSSAPYLPGTHAMDGSHSHCVVMMVMLGMNVGKNDDDNACLFYKDEGCHYDSSGYLRVLTGHCMLLFILHGTVVYRGTKI